MQTEDEAQQREENKWDGRAQQKKAYLSIYLSIYLPTHLPIYLSGHFWLCVSILFTSVVTALKEIVV